MTSPNDDDAQTREGQTTRGDREAMKSRLQRFRAIARDDGYQAAVGQASSWALWKLKGSRAAPLSPAQWVIIHQDLRPANPSHDTLFSVVVPVYDTPADFLHQCVASVRDQTHSNWELILVDDASPGPWMADLLADIEELDRRIRVIRRSENGGIAAATNTGIEASNGGYVVFVDHDDVLIATALEWISACTPDADLIYTDEAKIDEDGRISERVLKPAWSPRLLLAYNYVSHLTVVRRALLDQVGGLNDEMSGAQDHDLLLRIAEHDVTVSHVPSVLYLWRRTPDSTADVPSSKPYAEQAGLRAVADSVTRRGWNSQATHGRGAPFRYAVRWLPDDEQRPRIKIVIPTRDHLKLFKTAVSSVLHRTDHVEVELVIVDNGSVKPKTLEYLEKLRSEPGVHIVRVDDAFNFSRLCNIGAAEGPATDSILFLNNDVEVLHRDWLLQLHGWFADPAVVAAGTELFYEDGEMIQHAGVAVGSGEVGWHLSGREWNQPRSGDPHDCVHEVTGVTAACLLVRTSAFDAVGGFEEMLPTDFQDVDLCLKLGRRLGGTIIYDPMYPLLHHESASRGSRNAGSGYTVSRLKFRWPGLDDEIDPYFHPLAEIPHLGKPAIIDSDVDLATLLTPRTTTVPRVD